ncbi:hypothetical protein OTB20_18235 [Streptomyces sp. H27-H1]|uniref:hypothetical protein n=1 Tax=Streptomyces sp. H27-H1 TaxID=2996461 RepID=UPI00226FFB1C|nr:hypothetical protein [Streptomyces sp. H27-H1]MCY0928096.1 hypothetical protein [Streptomyces sp. H27-H1]
MRRTTGRGAAAPLVRRAPYRAPPTAKSLPDPEGPGIMTVMTITRRKGDAA